MKLKKIILGLFTLTLFSFAYLQLNDPDPIIWTSFYLICALVPALALLNKPNRVLFWIAILMCIVALGIYAHGAFTYYQHSHEEALMQSMNPAKPYIEEAREFLGSLIALCLVAASHYLYTSPAMKK
jgi:hypothetical protein